MPTNEVEKIIKERLDEISKTVDQESTIEKIEKEVTGECFNKTIPVENGDSVMFTVKTSKEVFLGKYVEKFNCVITPNGTVFDREKQVDDWFHIPFNIIQERLNTEAFNQKYMELSKMGTEEYKRVTIDEYVDNHIVKQMGTLDDDSQFLIGLFTRNVRNGKIDFVNYKFMMDLLFDKSNIEYDPITIDLRNLRTICYNMFAIMGKISQETYDKIYEKLASFTADNEVG